MIFAVTLLLACSEAPTGDHGHTHGGGHDHGGGHADHAEEGGESIAVTRWTDSHELFVELDAPVAGAEFSYHAHVTRLADNHAATSGALTIRFDKEGFPAESHVDQAVARPGIFASKGVAPNEAGTYNLVFSYADGEERAEWNAGSVTVGADAPEAHEGEDEGEITFLKEAQWQIPFSVAPAAETALAPTLSAAGVVRTSPASTAIVAAPTDGLVAWADPLPVVGREVKRGQRLATLIPAGAAEHWASLQAELGTARIDRELAAASLERIEGLAGSELVSERRRDEVAAEVARAEAKVQSARRRVSALTSGGAGAVVISAPSDGVVVSVGARHGETIGAGHSLVSVASDDALLVEGRVFSRGPSSLVPVASISAHRGDWDAPRDLLAHGAELLTERLVFDPDTLSAPLMLLVPGGSGLVSGDLVELDIGVGQPEPTLAIARSAVVEINGQPVVFVQKTGESFTRRRVRLGDGDATHVSVHSGVSASEMVVTEGGFDIHVASLSGALESHRH